MKFLQCQYSSVLINSPVLETLVLEADKNITLDFIDNSLNSLTSYTFKNVLFNKFSSNSLNSL